MKTGDKRYRDSDVEQMLREDAASIPQMPAAPPASLLSAIAQTPPVSTPGVAGVTGLASLGVGSKLLLIALLGIGVAALVLFIKPTSELPPAGQPSGDAPALIDTTTSVTTIEETRPAQHPGGKRSVQDTLAKRQPTIDKTNQEQADSLLRQLPVPDAEVRFGDSIRGSFKHPKRAR